MDRNDASEMVMEAATLAPVGILTDVLPEEPRVERGSLHSDQDLKFLLVFLPLLAVFALAI